MKAMKQAQEAFSKVDTKTMKSKINQAVNFMKKKMQDLKKSSENNEIAIKVNNKDAEKQITQLKKEIDSLQKKITGRQLKLDVINPQMDKIVTDTRKNVTPTGINPNSKAMDTTVDNALKSNKDFTSLNAQAQKLYTEMEMYNKQLEQAKAKMAELRQQTSQTETTQSKLSSFFGAFKQKIEQAKPSVNSIKNSFKGLPQITTKVTNNIKGMGAGLRTGLGHVFKYATALFSLSGIYSILSSCASTWLSSQNAGAKQLSANIEYMKYAMGSALAPVIQFVTNLVYRLMKAVQSVVYALTGVNIFANASAKSYSNMAKSAKKAKEETKQLAGVHDEINNIQSSKGDSGGGEGGSGTPSPSFDLSQVNKMPSSIVDAIKNGNWYEVGAIVGQKLNEAMASIPWGKIQDGARKIGKEIAQTLNGFIATTDWKLVGNTIAQGLNTAIYLAQSFVSTFDWKQFGKAISDSLNGTIKNIDWSTMGVFLSDTVKGILDALIEFVRNLDTNEMAKALVDFVTNIDWATIAGKFIELLLRAILIALVQLPLQLGMAIGDKLKEGVEKAVESIKEKVKENGGNVVLGILEGIAEVGDNIGQWVIEHIFQPFIDAFKNVFGIHSPSTIMAEQGTYIIQGLLNGILSLVGNITQIWTNMKSTAVQMFTDMKNSITNKVTEIKNGISSKFKEAYNNIKSTFGNLGNFFSGIWNGIKNTFSRLGTNIGNAIGGAVKTGINGVISLIERTINSAIRLINGGIRMINLIPGVYVGTINTLSLPRLAKGNVAYNETVAVFGEYSGARSNPEITAPQSILRGTFEDVLSDFASLNNSDRPINLSVHVGNTKLGQILINSLRDMKRQTGKDIDVLVGG